MICELAIFASLFSFCQSHEWHQRPLNIVGGQQIGHINNYIRHDQGFYNDGTNSGYSNKGVKAGKHKHLKKYGVYSPQNVEMCRHDGLMKQAEHNVASVYKKKDYVSFSNPITGKHHNCHDYKKAVNTEYNRLYKKNENKFGDEK